ncbi:hypothetical protein EVAR_21552_1 [Eumeta japonica]|uniref:Uncharacterized protein n=1 Tax=Eumeta variegata TaxID=151549 RepID=A0A4C1XNT5_EUMVA|nr:hypothetical protein EVAR_21552_1 [Eumeta japonica]
MELSLHRAGRGGDGGGGGARLDDSIEGARAQWSVVFRGTIVKVKKNKSFNPPANASHVTGRRRRRRLGIEIALQVRVWAARKYRSTRAVGRSPT